MGTGKSGEKLLYHIAYIESTLDTRNIDDLTGYSEELEKIVSEERKIQGLLRQKTERLCRRGIRTVILGKAKCRKVIAAESRFWERRQKPS